MSAVSRTVAGGVLFFFGLFFSFSDFFNLFFFFCGLFLMILGAYIFMNSEEDEIEQTNRKKKKYRR